LVPCARLRVESRVGWQPEPRETLPVCDGSDCGRECGLGCAVTRAREVT
jgi:hypothetical protein